MNTEWKCNYSFGWLALIIEILKEKNKLHVWRKASLYLGTSLSLLYKAKMQYVHFRLQTNFLLEDSWRNKQTIYARQITKGSIYHIKQMSNFLPWEWIEPEIGHLIEVSIYVWYLHILCFYFVCTTDLFCMVHPCLLLCIQYCCNEYTR